MKNIFNVNGLVCWQDQEIELREYLTKHFSLSIKEDLLNQNSAWRFFRIESSVLVPNELIHENYTEDDVFRTSNLSLTLRPETTQGSYEFARQLLKEKNKLPVCVWQVGKSFRNEQTQPTKNMRLKEFYQLEFQCIFSPSTQKDYSVSLVEAVKNVISSFIGDCVLEDSDRLPVYSEWTKDVICSKNGMEVCSISSRNDFENQKVIEVAIGLDRCVYCFNSKFNDSYSNE